MSLPAHALIAAQRILDAEARRLLADELNNDPVGANPIRGHNDTGDNHTNQGAASVKRQPVPIPSRVDRDEHPVAA